MAEWRFHRRWSDQELKAHLRVLRKADINFRSAAEAVASARALRDPNASPSWRRYYTEAVIAHETPGPPVENGPFEHAWSAIQDYEFSDPTIVTAHYDPGDPLLDRTMILEIHIFGLHYLCGVRINFERKIDEPHRTVRGFRYDTLEGHFEMGSEWFLLTKDHVTGEVRFRIKASWKPGDFPNWWTRLGFRILSERYQLTWHRLAYLRLRELVSPSNLKLKPLPYGRELVHSGHEVEQADLWVLKSQRPAFKAGILGNPIPVQLKRQKDAKEEKRKELLG